MPTSALSYTSIYIQIQNTIPNSKGHSVDDFRALIIERVVPNDGAWLLEREEMWIKRLETKKPHGLNRND